MRKICIINQKGGVAKTTTTVNLASGLARAGKKVLILDLDPQGNIATSLNSTAEKDMYDLLVNGADYRECIVHMGKNLDLISSRETLTKAELILVGEQARERFLATKLEPIKEYDYIILDCPPSLGLLNQNAMLYADEAIIPVSTDCLGYDALKKMEKAISTLNLVFQHRINVTKIVPTLYDQRNKICKKILAQIRNDYYELVAEPIRINSKLKEAPGAGMSIYSYDPACNGAKDYKMLVNSVIRDEERVLDAMNGSQATEDLPVVKARA